MIFKKKQLVTTAILYYNYEHERKKGNLVTTYCIYNGLLLLDIIVERPSKNGVSFNEAKEHGADIVKQWDSNLDNLTRSSHVKLDRQIREIDEDFDGDGGKAQGPGLFGNPAEDCNCRCALLTRARWALDNKFTKWDYEDGLKEFDPKDYDEYKKKYLKEIKKDVTETKENDFQNASDVTKKWLDSAKPGVGTVYEANYYDYNGIKYVIDGINVKQNNSKRELEVADLLLNKFGGEIKLIPEVNGSYRNVMTPDYLFNGMRFDLKEMTSRVKDGIRNIVHKKKNQADNFIIDISKSAITEEELNIQLKSVYEGFNTQFVDTIIIIRNNDIIRILQRK